jgi:ribosomal protein S18 acetylase RimI-like enzyme
VRLARPSEAATVHAIMRAAFDEYRGQLAVASSALDESVADVAEVMARGGAVLALVDDEPVGSARFIVETDEVYVGRVAVLPGYRRQGIASAIMRFIEAHLPGLGRASIRLAVRDSLPSNVGLYRSLGYEVVSIEPHPRGADRVWTLRKKISA